MECQIPGRGGGIYEPQDVQSSCRRWPLSAPRLGPASLPRLRVGHSLSSMPLAGWGPAVGSRTSFFWSFPAKKYRKVTGKEIYSDTLESTPMLEKEKFPQDYFPEVRGQAPVVAFSTVCLPLRVSKAEMKSSHQLLCSVAGDHSRPWPFSSILSFWEVLMHVG